MADVDHAVEVAMETVHRLAAPDQMSQEEALDYYRSIESEARSSAEAIQEELGE